MFIEWIPTDQPKAYILTKGELLKIDFSTQEADQEKAKSENSLAWNTGKLTFYDRPMTEIFDELEKLHDVNFELSDENLKNCTYTINFASVRLQDAIESLETICDLKFIQKDDSTYKVGGSCCE